MTSRTAALQQACLEATRSFLLKEYDACLQKVQYAMGIAASMAREERLDRSLVERLLVLRYTAMTTIYTNASVHARVLRTLEDSRHDTDALLTLLRAPAKTLYTTLWYEGLTLVGLVDGPPYPSSLDPAPEQTALVLRLPGPVLVSAVLSAVRLDVYSQDGPAYAHSSSRRMECARQTCEWYFSALLTPEGDAPDRYGETYERILQLYTQQILGVHLHEWAYAEDYLGYSTLSQKQKAVRLWPNEEIV